MGSSREPIHRRRRQKGPDLQSIVQNVRDDRRAPPGLPLAKPTTQYQQMVRDNMKHLAWLWRGYQDYVPFTYERMSTDPNSDYIVVSKSPPPCVLEEYYLRIQTSSSLQVPVVIAISSTTNCTQRFARVDAFFRTVSSVIVTTANDFVAAINASVVADAFVASLPLDSNGTGALVGEAGVHDLTGGAHQIGTVPPPWVLYRLFKDAQGTVTGHSESSHQPLTAGEKATWDRRHEFIQTNIRRLSNNEPYTAARP